MPRWTISAAVFVGLIVLWEAVKILFQIPAYKLPHVSDVLAEFVRPTGLGH